MPFKKGYIPWNKGKKCPQISKAKMGNKNPMWSKKSWNNGLTKETDERVKRNAEATGKSQKGKPKPWLKGRKLGFIPTRAFKLGSLHPYWKGGISPFKSFADYPKLRFDTNNGITLHKKCHEIYTYSFKGRQK